jgi:hypothetical protein
VIRKRGTKYKGEEYGREKRDRKNRTVLRRKRDFRSSQTLLATCFHTGMLLFIQA